MCILRHKSTICCAVLVFSHFLCVLPLMGPLKFVHLLRKLRSVFLLVREDVNSTGKNCS